MSPVIWRALSGPLAAEHLGDLDAPRITFVHGFTQTGNSWKLIAEQFVAMGFHAVIVDLPGHGGSANVRADLRRTADMVAALGGLGTYVGYSLGGRVCLHLALMYPHLVQYLVVVSANPGIPDADDRARRRLADDQLAQHLEEVDVETFLQEWTAQPLFGGLQLTDDERADRLRNTPEGLSNSLRNAGLGAQTSLWPRLRELNMPVLALAGADDAKFVAIAEQIAAATPNGRYATIPEAAHSVCLQNPDAVVFAIMRHLPEQTRERAINQKRPSPLR